MKLNSFDESVLTGKSNRALYVKSVIIVWIFVSFITFISSAAPFILPENTICKIAPECEWKVKYHKECPLCGMTSAFVSISKGQLKKASEQNRASVYLFSIFLMNSFIFFAYLLKIRKEKEAISNILLPPS